MGNAFAVAEATVRSTFEVFSPVPAPSFQPETMARVGPVARFLVVGLGNHGMEKTRHSIGMQVVSRMASKFEKKLEMDKNCKGYVAHAHSIRLDDDNTAEVILLKPKLLMNVNGRSIAATYKKYEIASPLHVMVIQDDLDRAFAKLSVKQGGSASGHNGVKSTIQCLNSDVFPRLRFGIGRPENRDHVCVGLCQKHINHNENHLFKVYRVYFENHLTQVSDFVLSGFTSTERDALDATALDAACDKILRMLSMISSTGSAVAPPKQRHKRQRNV